VATLLISDLHLCPTRPAVNRVFLDFLRGPARSAEALYILGDLFEYWAGDDDLDDPFVAWTCEALAALTDAGVATYFVRGNRDFLTGAGFARRAGVALIEDPTLTRISGEPTLLMHGDTLCTDDVDYQRFRAMVRDPQWQQHFLARPLAERKCMIEDLRRQSEASKSLKAEAIMDVNPDAVAAALRALGTGGLVRAGKLPGVRRIRLPLRAIAGRDSNLSETPRQIGLHVRHCLESDGYSQQPFGDP
jgi:UDP-2,3-diacylglucosamine hydrolase